MTIMAAPTATLFAALGMALVLIAWQESMSEPASPAKPVDGPGLRAWLAFLLVFFLLAAGIIAAGTVYYRNYERHYRAEVEHELSAIAELKVSQLVQWRKERLGDGSLFFQNSVFSALMRRFLEQKDADAQRELQLWIAKYQKHYDYDQVRLLDAQGVTRLSSPAGLPAISTAVARDVSDVLRSGQMMFQDFYRNGYDKKVYLGILVPILDERDVSRPLGVLAGRVDPESYLYPSINRWPTPSLTAETLLVRRDGNDALFLNELRFQTNTALSLRVPLDRTTMPAVQAALGQEGVMEGIDYRGVPAVAALRAIPDSPWALVARMGVAEVYGPMRGQLWQMVVLTGVLLLGAGTCVGLVWRQQSVRFYRHEAAAAETIRESEQRYRAVAQSAKDAIITGDSAGNIVGWNRGAARIFGYTEAEVNGQPLTLLIPQRYHDQHLAGVHRFQAGGESRVVGKTVELEGRRKDSSEFPLELSLAEWESSQGRFVTAIIRDITERKRAEAALYESERRYRHLFEANPLPMWVYDLETLAFLEVNDAAVATYGYRRDEFLAMTVADIRPIEDVPRLQADIAHVVDDAMDEGSVWRHRKKDGSIIDVEMRAHSINHSGRRARLVLAEDITDRKRAEDELRHSMSLLDRTGKMAMVGGWELDVDTQTVYWTEEVYRIHEIESPFHPSISWKAEPVIAAALSTAEGIEFYAPEARPLITAAVQAAIDAGTPFDLELPLVTANGRRIWVRAQGAAERRDGRTIRLYGAFQDITTRREAEESRRLQSAALHAAADGIVITDRTGVIEWVNPSFTQLTGYTAEEALGKNPRDLVKSGKHAPAFYRELWETILAGRPWIGDTINRRKDGALYTERQTITPIPDVTGAITHFVAIKRDITARLQLEAQFRQAQKMEGVGQLASGIAHDFNNLLTVINGMAELVLEQVGHDDPAHADVQEIHRAGARAATLTQQLLAFSRQQILEPRVLNVNTVVAEMESLLRRLLGEDVNLVVLPASDLNSVMADPGQLGQVLINLAVNARDAMAQGGKLTIATQNVTVNEDDARQHGEHMPPGSYVRLAVSDSGIGMDEDTRARAFEPFFTTKGPGKGTGLGLSTVYGIVKQSQGFIGVYSEVGRGTSFTIYLPQVAEAVGADGPAPAAAPGVGTETILLVEDNAGLRKLATRVLEPAGYTVLGAGTAEEALRLLERHAEPVHLLISDVVLPGMSGRLLAEQLTQIRPATKVLYMSGYTSDTVVRHGILNAQVPFLNKPFAAAALLRKVREVLDS